MNDFIFSDVFNVTDIMGIRTNTPYTFTIQCGHITIIPYYDDIHCGFKTREEAEKKYYSNNNYTGNIVKRVHILDKKKVVIVKNMDNDNVGSDFIFHHVTNTIDEAYKYMLREEGYDEDDTLYKVILYGSYEDSSLNASVIYNYNMYMIKLVDM